MRGCDYRDDSNDSQGSNVLIRGRVGVSQSNLAVRCAAKVGSVDDFEWRKISLVSSENVKSQVGSFEFCRRGQFPTIGPGESSIDPLLQQVSVPMPTQFGKALCDR